jgi:membrane peptidoglycan carboxypeptidase
VRSDTPTLTVNRVRQLVRFVVVVVAGGAGLVVATLALAGPARAFFTAGTVGPTKVDLRPLAVRSVVYNADGSVRAVLHAEENRLPVPIGQVSPVAVQAVLDVEDQRFWQHGALDVRSTLRALYTDVNRGQAVQGGSTITQQLVKNTVLSGEKRAHRKIVEAAVAVRLQRQMTKTQILEAYLNTVYFGRGAYGIEAAAETYWGTTASALNPGQAAMLAGMIQSPDDYDPVRFPVASRARRDVAIDLMREQGHITPGDAVFLEAQPLPSPSNALPKPDDYFVDHVVQLLLQDTRLGDTATERVNAVYRGGLQIHTTLDPRDQTAAQDAVQSTLPNTNGRFTAAVVSIDPETGAVRALVGGPGFEKSKFDLVTDGIGRQPGSSFKPFTLIAALEAGFIPQDTIRGSPPCPVPNIGGTPDPYLPDNVEGERGGTLTLDDAMVHSVNCAYAQLGYIVGLDRVVDVARRMGVRDANIQRVPAMVLGSEEVRPIEMASAYATLANDGVWHQPYFIDHVDDRDGKSVFRAKPNSARAVDRDVARQVTAVLRGVVQRGTGRAASLSDRPVAGKTGTAENEQDAWFVGYTPQLATAVWMGDPLAETPMKNVGGIAVFGGTYPARIWAQAMSGALAGEPVLSFPAPSTSSKTRRGRYLSVHRGFTDLVADDYNGKRRFANRSGPSTTVKSKSPTTTRTTTRTTTARTTTP